MSRILIGYANSIDSAILSGGVWHASYPLANIKNRLLSKVARTSNALAASTQLTLDLQVAQYIHCFAAISTNLSIGATYRLVGSNSAGFSTLLYDSGTLSAVYQTPDLMHALPDYVLARYWRLYITDTANAAGYVQMGRVFIGAGLRPEVNYARGAEFGLMTDSEVVQSIGGIEYFDEKPMRRRFAFTLPHLDDQEALVQAYQIQAYSNITREVLLIRDNNDTFYRQRRSFLGRLAQLSPIQNPYYGVHQTAFEILEII